MKRKEIVEKFDEIIDFSGVEKFLDTPLKHYSTGMQLRLAFAVAAFLEPEILLIDEVLAVGDAEFQKKCFEKMEDVTKKEGRTVVFVSHNLLQMQALCSKGIMLQKGKVFYAGEMQKAINAYLFDGTTIPGKIDVRSLPRAGTKNNAFEITQLHIESNTKDVMYENEPISLNIEFATKEAIRDLQIGFTIQDNFNTILIESRSNSAPNRPEIIQAGSYRVSAKIHPRLRAGVYTINLGARSNKEHLEFIPSVTRIEILSAENKIPEWEKSGGVILADSHWTFHH